MRKIKILVIGSGGREHAILWSLRKSSHGTLDLYCAPGNAGIRELAQCVPIDATDIAALVQFASAEAIDLTFVGPEGPLAAGIVDEFDVRGLAIAGPSRSASRLESSKAFAKQFMERHEIPSARFAVASSASEALALLRSGRFGASDAAVVVKADGLAAGKGVIVARSRVEAEKAVRDLMTGGLVTAEAAHQIVIEEALRGREASLLLFSDGNNYALMPPARDHKRIGEADTGPNTGGMGAITDPSVLDAETLAQVVRAVVEPTLEGARADGFPFRGVLFIGLMLTDQGPRVLEYNVRFGDPETQAILVRLQSDLAEIFQAIAEGVLAGINVEWTNESSACVVLASRGYPGKYESGARITGLNPSAREGIEVFHAGTLLSAGGEWLTAGGRVLGVTATGPGLDEALRRCYRAIDAIHWDGMQYRQDIGRFEKAPANGPADGISDP
ncbi:MAG TPA: phosphoribosylamine--glycine ligase [Pyrinomonadaceae bacterium]|nr:phosphoribosylamine--glycine ligase [Pyrinomonadaceae bacterium]